MTPNQVFILDHPLVSHHLAALRSRDTRPSEFRAGVARLAMLIGVHATEDIPLKEVEIETPITTTTCERLDAEIGIVPVLRAGLGMVDPLLELIPDASVWHLGLYRNEETAEPVGYYDKLPRSNASDVALVLDPMLATGGSIELVVRRLQRWGVSDIRVLSIIAAQPGLDRVARDFPDVKIYVAAVDPSLNENAFIVPGLGDAGDRIFDTPQTD
ncbi:MULTISPECIES: uracil phosphoribosyltransferase [Pirellulaceae]|uniref:Uracil phosphoribosyltransferase n=1 Tax=Aporhodopirellula rubra TaxID=980271 RepID=A0A7W5H412_9BACT|nr:MULTISPECIES: uracil phosphoribosyltransferase [Pirellulaceae]EMI42710.1 uracil phosphoribosyltransferase [Rhodopirellula sp. SWK7]MBB3204460.1 uracil phosphoribosyltransferase [Aporhodopirellula rubra]